MSAHHNTRNIVSARPNLPFFRKIQVLFHTKLKAHQTRPAPGTNLILRNKKMVPANKKYSSLIDGKHNLSLIDGKHNLSLIDGKNNLSLIDGRHNLSSIDGKHNLSLIDGKHNQSLVDRIHSVQIGQEPPNHKRGPETPPFEENVSPSSKEIKPATNL